MQYPYYPTELDFTNSMLGCREHSSGVEDISVLTHFTLNWRRLQAGGEILPRLVEFYQWLHTELAYGISKEKAMEVKIGDVIKKSVNASSVYKGDYLRQLFAGVKG